MVMKTGIPGKGQVLTQLSLFWFDLLKDLAPNHLITADIEAMPAVVQQYKAQLAGRVMLVKRLRILPVEAIVRGYLSGSGWKEYKKNQTVCGIALPQGLNESAPLTHSLYTPSTKAEIGDHDENIHPDRAAEILGDLAQPVADLAISLYDQASAYDRHQRHYQYTNPRDTRFRAAN